MSKDWNTRPLEENNERGSASHCCGDLDEPRVKCQRCTARADDASDWNTRHDGWVLTSERLPNEGHPLWMTDDNDKDVLPGLYLDGSFWLPEETLNGKWIVTRIERPLDEPPKRWRYMLPIN